jgi:hypothetical protein
VLRPVTPLHLPESTEVIITLRESSDGKALDVAPDPLLGLMAKECSQAKPANLAGVSSALGRATPLALRMVFQ